MSACLLLRVDASTAVSYVTGICDDNKKEQGQTLQSVGVFLDEPVFTHRQCVYYKWTTTPAQQTTRCAMRLPASLAGLAFSLITSLYLHTVVQMTEASEGSSARGVQ